MMSKSAYLIAATPLLFLFSLLWTACSQTDGPEPPRTECAAVFNVTLPEEESTRSVFGDGCQAELLQYALYDASTGSLVECGDLRFDGALSATVSMNLVMGKEYMVAFLATNGSDAYDFNAEEHTFTVDYSKMAEYNSTDYDVFHALYHTAGKVEEPLNARVTLIRPVAQLNWGTDDLNADASFTEAYGDALDLTTGVEVTGVYTQFDMFRGEVTGETVTAVFPAAAPPPDSMAEYPVEGYRLLSVQSLLVPSGSPGIIEAKITAFGRDGKVCDRVFGDLPLQANCKTNVYGSLLLP